MNEMLFTLTISQNTALGANQVAYWTMPVGATLLHVSAVGGNAHNATLMIGDSGNTDQAIAAFSIGASGTPAVKATADFDDPHFIKGDVFTATIDYDGSAGTAISGMFIVFTFLAG